jgi:hypothetical protein
MGLGFSKAAPSVRTAENVPGVVGVVRFRPWTVKEYEAMATARKTVFEKPDRTEAECTEFLLVELSKILLDETGSPVTPANALGLLKGLDLEAPTVAHLWDFALTHCGMAKPQKELEKN